MASIIKLFNSYSLIRRLKTPKKLFKRRSMFQFFIIFIVFVLCYMFGLFTHMLEQDIIDKDFLYPLKIDIKVALNILDRDLQNTKSLKINEFNFSYLHKAENICKPVKLNINNNKIESKPYLVILIKSKITHFKERIAIRKTWAQPDQMRMIRRVFLVGVPSPLESEFIIENGNNVSIISKLEIENEVYSDIVQQNFYDTYYNNTIKTFMGIRWVIESCSNSKYYLFIDDDFYLNPKLLMDYLQNNITETTLRTLYAGYVFENSSPMRHIMSKWYISLKDYPFDKFPPYVAAGCYLLSHESARLFYMASKIISRFKFDDIYMGILAQKLEIKPLHIPSIYYYAPTYYPSFYAREVIASHGFSAYELSNIWIQIEKFIKFESSF